MYIPSRGVIILSDVIRQSVAIKKLAEEIPNISYIKIDCGPRIIRDEIHRKNKQRESDTRKGIWRYNT